MRTRVLLIDAQTLLREGIKEVFRTDRSIAIVGEAGDGYDGVAQTSTLAPDVVVMDVALPGGDGIATIRAIRARCPSTQVVVLTDVDDGGVYCNAIAAGAAAYVLKTLSPAELASTIHTVAGRGCAPLLPGVGAHVTPHAWPRSSS